jgi:uncharacterized membrane protein YeaQ/YmgE (transglycosylase-associated protein family)
MNIVIPLVTGILIGWGSNVENGTGGRRKLFMSVVVGSIGAYLGGWALIEVYGPPDPGNLSFSAIVAAILGAATALVIVQRIRA